MIFSVILNIVVIGPAFALCNTVEQCVSDIETADFNLREELVGAGATGAVSPFSYEYRNREERTTEYLQTKNLAELQVIRQGQINYDGQ